METSETIKSRAEAGMELHQAETAVHQAKLADQAALAELRRAQEQGVVDEAVREAFELSRSGLHAARQAKGVARVALKRAAPDSWLPAYRWW